MDAENQNFSKNRLTQAQLSQLLGSEEGQALVRMLTRDGGAGIRAAADALQRGDSELARQILSPLLQNGKARNLAEQLGKKL